MFLSFFTALKAANVPVTPREYLTLMQALENDLAEKSVEDFYYLSRALLVKDERNLDRFDRVFAASFKGIESLIEAIEKAQIPEEWLKKLAEKYLTEEEKKEIEAMGWDKLMETLKKRLEEQKSAIRAARSGLERRGLLRSAPMASIPRACGSGRTRTAITGP